MTLQQLKYVITVANTGTITEAANRLFISQPSLTNAIHELEKEMNITIFNRTNKGISISKEGEDFLGYARQVLEQAAILEDKYKGGSGGKKQFCVSTQHYSFAVNAFVDLIKEYGQDEYDFSLRETQTYEIIEDVARMRSEIGILFLALGICAYLTIELLPLFLFIACLLGIIGYWISRQPVLPFAPFLCLSLIITSAINL